MQLNLSVSKETKDCLQKLGVHMHCSSLSEVITRLAWDAKHREDIEMERSRPKPDKSDTAFAILAVMAYIKTMTREFAYAFRNDYVYSLREYTKLFEQNELPKPAHDRAFIYTLDSTDKIPANAILRSNVYSFATPIANNDIQNISGNGHKDWTDDDWIDYWRIENIGGLRREDIRIRAIFKGTDEPNKLGEKLPDSSGLTIARAIGFEVVHKSGKKIICKWNEGLEDFTISLLLPDEIAGYDEMKWTSI